MDFVEAEGDTIDEAIRSALKELGVARDRVTIEILSEGSKGFLGFGAKKARVRATVRAAVALGGEEEREATHPPRAISREEMRVLGEEGKKILEEILRLMEIEAAVELKAGEASEEVVLDIQGDHGGLLIGRHGQTLEALQYILTRVLSSRHATETPLLVIDSQNYRARRRKTLEDMALRLGEKAKRQRKAVSIDALNAADRRIIHLALQDDPWLTTKSLGTGAYRRLLIIPEGDRKKKEPEKKPQPGGPKQAG